MARTKTTFACTSCGAPSARQDPRCLRCGEFGTIAGRVEDRSVVRAGVDDTARPVRLVDVDTSGGGELRVRTGMGELDRVLGGGLVAGSVVLLGGDPGVGKSTLLLMALDRFARKGLPVLYATGEESARQVRLRADRLGLSASEMMLLPHTDFTHVEAMAREIGPAVLVVDSVQTVHVPDLDGIPGSVSQIREVAHRATRFAKGCSTAVLLVGHVTKSGELAGPKVLEHLVDTVLYFEGDGSTSLRILRSVKNRFGAAGELGVFDMVEEGLVEVPDASARLLQERASDAPGTAVTASVEGSRPLLAEIQALVGREHQAPPARTCVGVDRARVLMLVAVLEKAGVKLYNRDVFVNAAGGVKLVEPATDLAIAAAIVGSRDERTLREDTLVFGEIGLVGEIRAVGQPGLRLKEAARHGFRRAVVPVSCVKEAPPGLQAIGVRSIREALAALL